MNRPDHSRRTFLKTAAATTAAVTVAPALTHATPAPAGYSPLNQWPGRCTVNYNSAATKGKEGDEAVIKKMVDDSIKKLTGENDTADAWKVLFPKLTLKTKIALKVNILNDIVPPHPFAVMAITEGLQKMKVEGKPFPSANIVIYDGFNGREFEKAGFTATRFPGITFVHHRKEMTAFADGAHNNQPYAKTLNECDYLINVPGLRGHDDWAGDATLGFKSHYGSYPPLYHDEKGIGYLRDINCTGPVFKKTVLTAVIGIFGLKAGNGPRGEADSYLPYAKTVQPDTENTAPNTIILSTDPVTAEFQAIRIMRLRDSKPFDLVSIPAYLKASAGVAGALTPVYNIGVLDAGKMDVRRFVNGKAV